MTLHHLASNPLGALQMAASYIQGGFFAMGSTPDEEMQLEQDSDWPSVLILMQKGDERGILELNLDGAPLIVDNTASGLGGIDTGSVAADTVYDLRVVCNEAGDLAGLIATVSGAAPTIPAGYPWASPVLAAGVTNGINDFNEVVDVGDGIFRLVEGGTAGRVLNSGNAVVPTYVDLSSVVPWGTLRYGAWFTAINNAAPSLDVFLSAGPIATSRTFKSSINNVSTAAGETWQNSLELNLYAYTEDPAEMLIYQWSGAPTAGLTVYFQWFQIKRR